MIEAADKAAAAAISAQDPYAKAGLFESVEIRAWNWVFNNPAAARIMSGASEHELWLFKSEPFDVFLRDAEGARARPGTQWDGVRNYAARNNMRAMQIGDLGFFYHSNEGLDVVGIAEVCALAHHDTTTDDPRWECVDIRAVQGRAEAADAGRDQGQSEACRNGAGHGSARLSVQPVTPAEWKEVCRMGGLMPAP